MTAKTSPHRPPCTEGDHCGELHCPPPAPRRRLTEREHDRAWHAIEGLDWEAADPDTVLNAVLRALDIDPPGTSWTPCTPAWLATQPAGACDTTPRRDGHDDVSHYHLAAEGVGA